MEMESEWFTEDPIGKMFMNSGSGRCGTPQFRTKLSGLLMENLKKRLPECVSKIKKHLADAERELESFGPIIDEVTF